MLFLPCGRFDGLVFAWMCTDQFSEAASLVNLRGCANLRSSRAFIPVALGGDAG